MITVVHLITLLELGGAQGNTLFTVRHLDSTMFDAHLWTGQGAFWDEDAQKDLGPRQRLKFLKYLVRPLNPLFDLLAIAELFFALRKLRPTILHTHSSKAGILGRIAGFMAGVPIIIHTFHGFGFNDQQKPWTRFCFVTAEKICALLSDRLIFVSQANWNEARSKKIGNETQYELIRSGVDFSQLKKDVQNMNKNAVKNELLGSTTSRVITIISAFKPQKNLIDFIRMAEKVSKDIPDIRFLMLGDGEMRSDVAREIEKLDLQKTVLLLGWRKDIAAILGITDLFVLTSLWEGLPRALVESCSLGIPAVCYDTDGVRDVLIKGGGYLIPQKDVTELCLKITQLLTDSSLYKQKSTEAASLIGIDFDINHMVRQQENLYQTLLTEASSGH